METPDSWKNMEKISFKYHGRKVKLDVKPVNVLVRILGLMFKSQENAEALLFEFRKPAKISIHSFFVFFPFIAVWLDKNNKVIDVKKVEPFTFSLSPAREFIKLIEIPVNKKYSNTLKIISRR